MMMMIEDQLHKTTDRRFTLVCISFTQKTSELEMEQNYRLPSPNKMKLLETLKPWKITAFRNK